MKSFRHLALGFMHAFAVASTLSAGQAWADANWYWPLPWKAGTSPTVCNIPYQAEKWGINGFEGYVTVNRCSLPGRSPVSYSSLLSFRGRFLDSTPVNGVRMSQYRPVRAERVLVAPELQRIFVGTGSGLLSYSTTRFFDDLNKPEFISSGPATRTNPRWSNEFWSPLVEHYLMPDESVFPEAGCMPRHCAESPNGLCPNDPSEPNGGWYACKLGDDTIQWESVGNGFDYDERNYVYMSTWYGWSILRLDPIQNTLQLLNQRGILDAIIPPDGITASGDPLSAFEGGGILPMLVFRHEGRHYISQGRGILDVTDPRSVRVHPQSIPAAWMFEKNASIAKVTYRDKSLIAMVNSSGELGIYASAELLAGAVPAFRIHSAMVGSSALPFRYVASDGNGFYALSSSGTQSLLSLYRPQRMGDPQSYQEVARTVISTSSASGLHYGGGFVSVLEDVPTTPKAPNSSIYKLNGTGFTKIDTGNYFHDYYDHDTQDSSALQGLPLPTCFHCTGSFDNVVTQFQGKLYVIQTNETLGDIYELTQ